MKSARATPGVAVSLHLETSRRFGQPTVLSNNQICYMMSRSEGTNNPNNCLETTHLGTMDQLYDHLEYISLLQKIDSDAKGLLINKTKIGNEMVDSSPIPRGSPKEVRKAMKSLISMK